MLIINLVKQIILSRLSFFPNNSTNTLAKKGIENAFPIYLFDGFKTTIESSTGEVQHNFDNNRKRDFENFVLQRNNIADFGHFSTLIDEINRIKEM